MRTGYASLLSLFTLSSSWLMLFHLPPPVYAGGSKHFVLKDEYVGSDFYSGWRFETMDDPTHGRVNYVDQGTAVSKNLTYVDPANTKFIMRADFERIVPASARGRDSIRISSYAAYDEQVIVLDVQHMPEGCSTWPAFWTLNPDGPWPKGGEIDIIEGVNNQAQNMASLHTSPYCTMPQNRLQTGETRSTNCDTNFNYNQGCGTAFNGPNSYGADFNANGGGYFVMARTKQDGIRVWYWQRDDPSTPKEVRGHKNPGSFLGASRGISPDPSWGTPDAFFPTCENCEYDTHFSKHMMIFDLTFCGDWAGNDYPNSGCPGNCVDLVNNNPAAFKNAYWEINSLRVFTPYY